MEEVRVCEGEDELDDVEEDREDEVRSRDPEERAKAGEIGGACGRGVSCLSENAGKVRGTYLR